MKVILELGNGERWILLETVEEAQQEEELSRTAVGGYFRHDLERAGREKTVPPCYYSLRSDLNREPLVTARVRAPSETTDTYLDRQFMFVGQANTDPFYLHEDAIRALGEHLGVLLDRNAYPYRGPKPNPELAKFSVDDIRRELQSRNILVTLWDVEDAHNVLERDTSTETMKPAQIDRAAKTLFHAVRPLLADVLTDQGYKLMEREWMLRRQKILEGVVGPLPSDDEVPSCP